LLFVGVQLEDARQTISFELETLDIRPDPEPLLIEMIHAVSWKTFIAFRLLYESLFF